MSSWATWRNRVGMTLAVLALSAAATVTSLASAPAGAAVAASGGSNTYTLSGAVSGTLHDGPTAGCPYGGIDNKGFVELTDLVGSTSGIKGVASWSLDINVKKNGTFKFKALPIGDPNAELNVNLKSGNIGKGVADNFFAYGGSVTVKGDSGSINAPMRQATGGKSLKLVARWACGSTAAAQAVSGSGWKTPVLVTKTAANTAPPQFSSVSCPSTSFCAAVDTKGSAATLNDGSWSSLQNIDSTASSDFNDTMGTVSCASASFCVAGDNLDDVYTYNGSSWSALHQLNSSVTDATVGFAVSCPTTSFCLAVDGNFNWYTYNGSTWSAAQVIDSSTLEGIVIGEVSCASATFCEAAFGQQTVTYNGSSWSAPVKVPVGAEGSSSSTPSIEALSCASSTLCAGVGTTSNNEGYLDTFNGTAWATPQIKKTGLGPQAFVSVSCPTTSFCMAPGLDGWVRYNGTSWGAPQTFADPGGPVGEGPLYANAVSCTSAKFCEEVEDSGYADVWKG
jgi:hypothetical protein